MPIPSFPSFHAAVGYLIGLQPAHAHAHPYTVTDVATFQPGTRAGCVDDFHAALDRETENGPLHHTLAAAAADYSLGQDTAALYSVGCEAHYGYVLAHYTKDSKPVSFHAFE